MLLWRRKRFVSWLWTTLWKVKWPMSPCYCEEGKDLSADHELLCEKQSDLCLHVTVKKEKICQLIMDYFVKSEVTYVSILLWRRKRFVSWSWTTLWKAKWPNCVVFWRQVRQLIADCFVTGRWDKSEDALARLQEDGEFVWLWVYCEYFACVKSVIDFYPGTGEKVRRKMLGEVVSTFQ